MGKNTATFCNDIFEGRDSIDKVMNNLDEGNITSRVHACAYITQTFKRVGAVVGSSLKLRFGQWSWNVFNNSVIAASGIECFAAQSASNCLPFSCREKTPRDRSLANVVVDGGWGVGGVGLGDVLSSGGGGGGVAGGVEIGLEGKLLVGLRGGGLGEGLVGGLAGKPPT